MTKKGSFVKTGVSNTHGIIFEKTHKAALLKKLLMGLGVDLSPAQQQRPESPTVTLSWHASKHKVRPFFDDAPLVEFMYLVSTQGTSFF